MSADKFYVSGNGEHPEENITQDCRFQANEVYYF